MTSNARRRERDRRSLRPMIGLLEGRCLLAGAAPAAYPTFVVGPLSANSGPLASAYTPAQIDTAYAFSAINFGDVAADGKGETIAIVDAYHDATLQNDLNVFDSQFGLLAAKLSVVNQTGGTTAPPVDSTGGWELEESLDVEWAHAIAPEANILLVEANSNNDTDLYAAVAYASAHANIVSMSWAGGEFSGETGDDTKYFDVPNVAFVASSGDSGAPAAYPATSPDVLAVGGTALTLGSGNAWSSEVGWSGSGGGPSSVEPQPSYQKGVVTQTTTQRANPDVAYDASLSTGFNVYDSTAYNGTVYDWAEVGGTSAGAPQWAALLAIADQGRALGGLAPLDSSSPQQVMDILYQNQSDFHDITSGSSTGSPQYSAGPGYDYVTGLGSPIANLVVAALDPAPVHDKLVLSAPANATAGTSFDLTVTAETPGGAIDTGYLGTIQFSSSDLQAELPSGYTFTAADQGTAQFLVTLKTAGKESVSATDTATAAITGSLSGVTVSAAAASQFVFAGLPTNVTAGTPLAISVVAEDAYGNVATSFVGSVQFTSSDPQASLPSTAAFTAADQGTSTDTVVFETAGPQSLTAADSSAGLSVTQSPIAVHPGTAKSIVLSGFPLLDTAGLTNSVTVTAFDQFGNVATGYTGTVTFSSTDPLAGLPSSYTFKAADGGQHAFGVTLDTAGTQSVTATDSTTPSLTATESKIVVQPAGASSLKVVGVPATLTAGKTDSLTITVYDPFGNVATGYSGSVVFTSSDPRAVLPAPVTFVSGTGIANVTLTLETAGSQSITVTDDEDSSITGTEPGITVRAAAASALQIAGPTGPLTAGTSSTFTVTAVDPYGNVATSFAGPVSFTSSDAHAGLPLAYTFGAGDQGTHGFSVVLDTAGSQTLTATDVGMPSLTFTDTSISVQPAAAHSFVLSGLPSPVITGTSDEVTITAYDAFGNVATGYVGTASLSSSDLAATLPAGIAFASADAGSSSFSITFQTVGPQSIAAADTASPSVAGGLSGIPVHAVPQLSWTAPASIIYGTALGSVQLDATANVAGTFTYTPDLGTVLNAGVSQEVSVLFTPTNPNDYTTATTSTEIDVLKATPTFKVADAGGSFGGHAFAASATIAGVAGTYSASLDGMTPTFTYYLGTGTLGSSLGSTAPAAPGSYTVVASVSGDDNYAAAQSAPVTFTIARGGSSVALASPSTSTVYGEPLSLVATVAGVSGTPTGAVTFWDAGTPLATVPLGANGTADYTASTLAVGSHAITATYGGDTNLLGSQSSGLSESVGLAGTALALSRTSVLRKKTVTAVRLTAQVAPSAPGGGLPTGTVTFEIVTTVKRKQKVTKLGTAAVVNGQAVISLKPTKIRNKAITIVYGGDGDHLASTLNSA